MLSSYIIFTGLNLSSYQTESQRKAAKFIFLTCFSTDQHKIKKEST